MNNLENKTHKEQESYERQLSDLIYRFLKPSTEDLNRIFTNNIAKEINKNFHLYSETDVTEKSYECICAEIKELENGTELYEADCVVGGKKVYVRAEINCNISGHEEMGAFVEDSRDIEINYLDVDVQLNDESADYTVDLKIVEDVIMDHLNSL